jgi:hypothetical protein
MRFAAKDRLRSNTKSLDAVGVNVAGMDPEIVERGWYPKNPKDCAERSSRVCSARRIVCYTSPGGGRRDRNKQVRWGVDDWLSRRQTHQASPTFTSARHLQPRLHWRFGRQLNQHHRRLSARLTLYLFNPLGRSCSGHHIYPHQPVHNLDLSI